MAERGIEQLEAKVASLENSLLRAKADYQNFQRRSTNEQAEAVRFAWDKRYKLYATGNLYDMREDFLEENPIPEGQRGEEALRARERLKAAIASMPDRPDTSRTDP